jgi:hypothetical protein
MSWNCPDDSPHPLRHKRRRPGAWRDHPSSRRSASASAACTRPDSSGPGRRHGAGRRPSRPLIRTARGEARPDQAKRLMTAIAGVASFTSRSRLDRNPVSWLRSQCRGGQADADAPDACSCGMRDRDARMSLISHPCSGIMMAARDDRQCRSFQWRPAAGPHQGAGRPTGTVRKTQTWPSSVRNCRQSMQTTEAAVHRPTSRISADRATCGSRFVHACAQRLRRE